MRRCKKWLPEIKMWVQMLLCANQTFPIFLYFKKDLVKFQLFYFEYKVLAELVIGGTHWYLREISYNPPLSSGNVFHLSPSF